MADSSSNALVPGTGSRSDDHTAPVLRELSEMMMMERGMMNCKDNEERYNLLFAIVERELPWALEIPPPTARGTVEYKLWETDMKKMELLYLQFQALPGPSMPTPFAKPLRGGDTAYQYLLPGGRNLGTIEAEHTGAVLPAILRPEVEKAFYEAAKPLRSMHVGLKRVYKKYHIWDERTEVALRLSDWSEEYGQHKIDNAYVAPVPGAEDGGPVESIEEDEEDENLGFMDSEDH
jgi:hypothetical protein